MPKLSWKNKKKEKIISLTVAPPCQHLLPVATVKTLLPRSLSPWRLHRCSLAPWPPKEVKEAPLDLLLLLPSFSLSCSNPNPSRRDARDLAARRRSPPTLETTRSRSAWGKRTAVFSSSSSSKQSSSGAGIRRNRPRLLRH